MHHWIFYCEYSPNVCEDGLEGRAEDEEEN